MRGNPKFSALT